MFKIKCEFPDGTTNTTIDIGVLNGTTNIRDRIWQACPHYREKFELTDGPAAGYYEDVRDLQIRFISLNYDIPQFELLQSDDNPVEGNEIVLNSTTWIPYNPKRIFYEPVPFEFLHTAETKPQVIVSVDGIEAVCASLACDYTYVAAQAQIDSFSLTGTQLSIVGSGFTNPIR